MEQDDDRTKQAMLRREKQQLKVRIIEINAAGYLFNRIRVDCHRLPCNPM